MLKNIKYLAKHSIIYSISNVAVKASGVILLPLYSKYFNVSEFGILGILEATLLIAVEFLNLGLGQSLVMMSSSDEFKKERNSVFFSIFTFLLLICIVFLALGKILLPHISQIFQQPGQFYWFMELCLYIIVLRVLNSLFLNKIRADEKSGLYTVINLIKLAISLGFTIYFIAFQKRGIDGVLISYIIAEGLNFLILLPAMIKAMALKLNRKSISISIKFGVPLIFGSLAMMLLNVSDRYIIKLLRDYSSVGLYDLGYRVAGILNMFFIMPFGLALMPAAYKMYNQPGDKRYYSKMMTYLTYFLVWLGLGLSLFSKEVISTFTLNSSYLPAYKVIPIVVFSYVFFGMRYFSSLGLYLTKNTRYVAITTIFASLLNIGLNFLFIPKYGMIAAAWNTLISFIVLYFLTNYYSDKFFKIPFENSKLVKVILVGTAFYFIGILFNDAAFLLRLAIKLLLIIAFPFILYILKFYESVELESIRILYRKWSKPSEWKNNIKTELFSKLMKS